jgi:hypothetical protein
VTDRITDQDIAGADLVTNSGHLRPLDRSFVEKMKPASVITLMFETWEFRVRDVDLLACADRGIRVVGTNERHPNLRLFDYLGILAVVGLVRIGVAVAHCRLLLVCDNAFGPFIASSLLGCGAALDILGPKHAYEAHPRLSFKATETGDRYDAAVIAHTPGEIPIVGKPGLSLHSREKLGAFRGLVQIWGDVDYTVLSDVDLCPTESPAPGHMGMLFSELGPDPIVRLQAGGLKAGEQTLRGSPGPSTEVPYFEPMCLSSRSHQKE